MIIFESLSTTFEVIVFFEASGKVMEIGLSLKLYNHNNQVKLVVKICEKLCPYVQFYRRPSLNAVF